MKRLIILLNILLISLSSQAQGVRVYCCGSRPQDTAVIARNAIISGAMEFPFYQNSDSTQFLTVDSKGNMILHQVPSAGGGGSGTVTSITAGSGLIGGRITTSGTIAMPNIGTAGTYGSSTQIPVITTDAQGRVSAVGTATFTAGSSGVTSITATSPIHATGTTTTNITVDQSGMFTDGYLNSTDWNIFNNKGSGSVTSVKVVSNVPAFSVTPISTITSSGIYSIMPTGSSVQYVRGDGTLGTYNPGTGTVTSVGVVAGSGVSITGTSPITGAGTFTVVNTAPDQTVSIANGTGINVTGTYPNFTVTNTSPSSGGTVTSIQVVSNASAFSVTPTSAIASSGIYSIVPTGTSSQFVKADGSKDGTSYLTGNQPITLSGAVTGIGSTSISTTLAASVVGTANLSATGTPSIATYLRGDNTWATPAGAGTVTSVNVVTANGVSGSVSNPTSTPAITLTLGAITPTSVNASGTVAGSNLSGTNTGDQTITLTGDVTGSGTSSFATTLKNTGSAGTYGSSTLIPIITTDAQGRVSSVSTTTFAIGVNSVVGTAPISVSGTSTVTVSLNTTGTAATYGTSTQIPVFTTDAYGRVNAVTNTAIGTLNQNTSGTAANVTGVVAVVNGGTGATVATSVNTTPITYGANNTVTVPIATGVTGLGTGIATWLATPTSANLATAVATTSTGSGSLVFSASPALTGSPTVPTQTAGDNSTKVASTAYVDATYGIQYTTAANYSTSTTPTSTVASRSAGVQWVITAQAGALLFNAPTGSWADMQWLETRISSGSSSFALTYNAAFTSGTVTPASATTASQSTTILWQYNSSISKWQCVYSGVSN